MIRKKPYSNSLTYIALFRLRLLQIAYQLLQICGACQTQLVNKICYAIVGVCTNETTCHAVEVNIQALDSEETDHWRPCINILEGAEDLHTFLYLVMGCFLTFLYIL